MPSNRSRGPIPVRAEPWPPANRYWLWGLARYGMGWEWAVTRWLRVKKFPVRRGPGFGVKRLLLLKGPRFVVWEALIGKSDDGGEKKASYQQKGGNRFR